jgi:hypothetical protein
MQFSSTLRQKPEIIHSKDIAQKGFASWMNIGESVILTLRDAI